MKGTIKSKTDKGYGFISREGEFWNIDKLAKVKQTANEVNIIK